MNSSQVQLRLNNGAVVDPDDRVGDVVDDREEVLHSIAVDPLSLYSFTVVIRHYRFSSIVGLSIVYEYHE